MGRGLAGSFSCEGSFGETRTNTVDACRTDAFDEPGESRTGAPLRVGGWLGREANSHLCDSFHCCPGESAQPRVLPGETTAGVSRAASAAGMPRDALHAPSDKRAPVARACRWLGADLALTGDEWDSAVRLVPLSRNP